MRLKNSLIINAVLLAVFFLSAVISPLYAAVPNIVVRDDGLTVVTPDPADNKEKVQYITMIVKTGYGHDPVSKSGLTDLTNALLYLYLRYNTRAAGIAYATAGDYSIFNFKVTTKNFTPFCNDLDEVLRTEVLFGYDFCNAWIEYYKNAPRHPGLFPSFLNLSRMLYGPDHPYTRSYNPDYNNLNVNELNKWFRKIYRLNNIIISSSLPLPDFFLRRPSGKEFKEPVNLPKIAPPTYDPKPALKYEPDHDNSSFVSLGFPAPGLDADDYLSLQLGWIYLFDTLTDELREKNGYVYYVTPFSTAKEEASAPAFIIYFQTLPEDTGAATQMAIDVLKNLAKSGIPEVKLAKIIESEKKRLALRDKSLGALTSAYAFRALYNVKWIGDSQEYLSRLPAAAKNVSKVFADRLPLLKVSVAGPEGVEKTMKTVSLDDLASKP